MMSEYKIIDLCSLVILIATVNFTKASYAIIENSNNADAKPNYNTSSLACDDCSLLLILRESGIFINALNDGNKTYFINNTGSSDAMDFLHKTRTIFWNDKLKKKIYKAQIDKGNDHVVVADNVEKIHGLAIDWIYNNLYWIDDKENAIIVKDLNATSRKTLFKDDLNKPRSMVLNPMDGWMFWINWKSAPKIERGGMDGTNREVIINSDTYFPSGLTIDYDTKRIYWADGKHFTISSCDYNGNNLSSSSAIPKWQLSQSVSMTAFKHVIYFIGADEKIINKFDMTSGQVNIINDAHLEKVAKAISIYDQNIQPNGINYCGPTNGGCSHLCLPSPRKNRTVTCACPDGLHIESNNKTCVESHQEKYTTHDSFEGCPKFHIRCRSGECILNSLTCNGVNDCVDGSDELLCSNSRCSSSYFECTNKACIPYAWKCDFEKDCSDGSDENGCVFCNGREFICDTNVCQPLQFKCDGNIDCKDGSDEIDCVRHECGPEEFTCKKSRKCIHKNEICDGILNCSDGSDEVNCFRTGITCSETEFQCNEFECIPKTYMCDGEEDCTNGKDESIFHCPEITCRPNHFNCDNRTCVPNFARCSGLRDCPNGIDEIGCPNTHVACDFKHEFDCGDGQCIPLSNVCNGVKDCNNLSDEPPTGCQSNKCTLENGGCSQLCVDTLNGHHCECISGYKLGKNGLICEDINECELPGSCSQICINEIGSFKCKCLPGYMLDTQNFTKCKAEMEHVHLVYNVDHAIQEISLHHKNTSILVGNIKRSSCFDFLYREGILFWSELMEHNIISSNTTNTQGAKSNTLLQKIDCRGMAVDWIYYHLYFIHENTIEVSNLNGSLRSILVQDNLDEPTSIALDPNERWMFWIAYGNGGNLERAGMDGKHRQSILSFFMDWPNDLTLDLVNKRVYWVDGKLHTLSYCDYDGRNPKTLMNEHQYLTHPFSITTFEDWVYWTEFSSKSVYRVNKFTGKELQHIPFYSMAHFPHTLRVKHPYRQPQGENYCITSQCSHLCLPSPMVLSQNMNYSCACPKGFQLKPDQKNCFEYGLETKEITLPPSINTISIVFGVIAGLIGVGLLVIIFIYGKKICIKYNHGIANYPILVFKRNRDDLVILKKNHQNSDTGEEITNHIFNSEINNIT